MTRQIPTDTADQIKTSTIVIAIATPPRVLWLGPARRSRAWQGCLLLLADTEGQRFADSHLLCDLAETDTGIPQGPHTYAVYVRPWPSADLALSLGPLQPR